eukprot:CAMPEP_0198301478 /NCGR_PEP_ID=MMETSP1449-20131203/51741_1 /TAXON_ID=420275 /ORGANISM="Attheya septentrionalis, Strain CCMP2084" /LENGTH=301 /DNA_ID=CAMNT_0044003575 /DNA_START=55 /DNA_END=960 /DNA_ORIENTATION=+
MIMLRPAALFILLVVTWMGNPECCDAFVISSKRAVVSVSQIMPIHVRQVQTIILQRPISRNQQWQGAGVGLGMVDPVVMGEAARTLMQTGGAYLDPTGAMDPESMLNIEDMLPRSMEYGAMVETPDGFYMWLGILTGLVGSISKTVTRAKIEERAWERRLEEAREQRLLTDPTLTELDLRRDEAANSYSVYGPSSRNAQANREREYDRNMSDDDYDDNYSTTATMTDEQIADFEQSYGVQYDPYYDDPYEEDELPPNVPFKDDRRYGDRVYENGETFYKDQETGLFYREGSKPRQKKFWNF